MQQEAENSRHRCTGEEYEKRIDTLIQLFATGVTRRQLIQLAQKQYSVSYRHAARMANEAIEEIHKGASNSSREEVFGEVLNEIRQLLRVAMIKKDYSLAFKCVQEKSRLSQKLSKKELDFMKKAFG